MGIPSSSATLSAVQRRWKRAAAPNLGSPGDVGIDDVAELIDRWISKASRSRLAPFVKAAKTIRKHRDGILAAIRLKINNGLDEALNNVVRLIIRRAYGFHSAEAALALVLLSCGPIALLLPHERAP